MRMLDEHGSLDPQARPRAIAERQANLAHSQSTEAGGIGRFNWRERGPDNFGGRTRALVIHPVVANRMFAGSVGGGIWRSEDAGLTWAPVNDWLGNLAICSLAIAPGNNPDILYAGTGEGFGNIDAIRGEGIWKSIDGGTTWAHLPSTSAFGAVNRIAVSPSSPNLVLAATETGIRRSTDGGVTWSTVRTGNARQVLFDPNLSSRAVAHVRLVVITGFVDRVVVSNDAGVTWITATGIPSSDRIELCFARATPGMVYASQAGSCWRSTDGGTTWTERTTTDIVDGDQWWYDNAIWVDPVDSSIVVIGAINIWRSSNGGQTFTRISDGYIGTTQPHSDVHFFAHDPGYNGTAIRTLFAATDGGIYRTADIRNASTTSGWTNREQGYRAVQFYGVAGHSSGRIAGGTQDNGTLTIDPLQNSAVLTFGGDGGYTAMDPTDPDVIFGETQFLGMHRSIDGGATATPIRSGLLDYNTCTNFIAPLALAPSNPDVLFAGGCSLWRCTNAKAATPTWTSIKPTVGSPISAIAVSPTDPNLVWIGHNDGRVFRTTDALTLAPNWIVVDDNAASNPFPGRVITRILIDRASPTRAFVALGGFQGDNLRRTTNTGTTWSDVTGVGATGLPAAPIYGIAQHPSLSGRFYVATEVGVFGTSDNCATWSTSNDGPADVSCNDITFLHGSSTLLVGTHGRGVWTSTIAEPGVATLGTGCAGSAGTPALTATAPRIGTTVDLAAASLVPETFVWLLQGQSSTDWLGNPLPFHLLPFGAANCHLRVSAEIVRDGRATTTGAWTGGLPIAPVPGLLGRSIHVQLFALDRAANTWGMTTSNALTLTIGN